MVFLGLFSDPVEAAENYDFAVVQNFGRDGGYLNFPKNDYQGFVPKSERPKSLRSDNVSGMPGVSWDTKRSRWYAWIAIRGKMKNLGRFFNKEDAMTARTNAEGLNTACCHFVSILIGAG